MKYLKFNCEDGVEIKFKISKRYPYGLSLIYKEKGKIFGRTITITERRVLQSDIEKLESMTDEEFIYTFKKNILDDMADLRKIKRRI